MAQASPYVPPPPNPRKLSVSLELDHFPPLPEVAWRVLELTSDLYLGVDKLAEVISRDQTLTARILRIANSAFFQRLCEIKTVKHASTVLGNRKIRGIVIAASLGGILYRSPQGRLLWQHALGVGLAARELSFHPVGDEALLAGARTVGSIAGQRGRRGGVRRGPAARHRQGTVRLPTSGALRPGRLAGVGRS